MTSFFCGVGGIQGRWRSDVPTQGIGKKVGRLLRQPPWVG